jgi:ABC-type cobalamin/Fe3+-siderophores transport system ATPase subunit
LKLEVKNVSYRYDLRPIIDDVSFTIQTGDILTLLGPNGTGKTTLFKVILGLLKANRGEILIDGINTKNLSRSKMAKLIGYVPQNHIPPFSFKVLDVILMGRTAHLKAFASPTQRDVNIALEAMDTLKIGYLKDKMYTEISGGERQLVLIARALTQTPKLLIMDEPTANLDFGNQIKVLKHVQYLKDHGLGIIMSTHNPDHALQYATKVALMNKTHLNHLGRPEEVITEENLAEIYGVHIQIANAFIKQSLPIKVCLSV